MHSVVFGIKITRVNISNSNALASGRTKKFNRNPSQEAIVNVHLVQKVLLTSKIKQ